VLARCSSRRGRRFPGVRRAGSAVALVAVVALTATACGGGGGGDGDGNGSGNGARNGVPANGYVASVKPPDEGTPKRGGKITYALEGPTDNLCPPTGQWAISGIMIGQSIYDTLTAPDSDGNLQPYLAKSVEHDSTYKVWTIKLREGIEFHNGEKLDAAAVKQNIDAWRKGVLLQFVYQNLADTRVVDPLTVEVTMKAPWVAFPAYLWTSGRVGIAAPAQLADMAKCQTNLIGTGPFKLKKFDPTTGAVDVVRNPSYWRKGFPYLDEIDFRIQGDGTQRTRGLQGGEFDVIHGSGGVELESIAAMGDQARVALEPWGRMEVSHMLLNVGKEPFNDPIARRAIAMGADRAILNRISNGTNPRWRIADQVFDTDVPGYVKDPGFPKRNLAEARRLVKQYEQKHGKKLEFDLQSTYDSTTKRLAREVQRQAATYGVKVNLPPATDQGTIISKAVAGGINAFLWRNYWGIEPDTMFVWFHSGSTVNFNHIDDPVVDKALEEGRTNPDPAARKKAYETFSRRLSTEAYSIWSWYSQWYVATKANVHGIVGPALPDENGEPGTIRPVPMVAGYHQLLGMWVS